MNNDTTNSGKQQRRVKNIFVLKTNVLHSGIVGLRMRTTYLPTGPPMSQVFP
jgi:hypothetical protein